jgi:hypothetical protein
MSPYARMRDPLENRELTFAGSLPLDGRPEELLLEELTDLMDDAALRVRRIRNRMLLLSFTVDATMGDGDEPRRNCPAGTALGAYPRSKYGIETRWVARASRVFDHRAGRLFEGRWSGI